MNTHARLETTDTRTRGSAPVFGKAGGTITGAGGTTTGAGGGGNGAGVAGGTGAACSSVQLLMLVSYRIL